MNRLDPKLLAKLFIGAVSIIYGMIDYGGASLLGQSGPDTMTSVFRAIVFLLLAMIFEQCYELSKLNAEEPRELDVFIDGKRSFLTNLVSEIDTELQHAVHIDRGAVVVDHQTLALTSYHKFWQKLVDEQRTSAEKLDVLITHSGDMNVWSSDSTMSRALLERQKEFCEEGGNIERILIGEQDEPNSDVIEAARKMKEVGIQVSYHNRISGLVQEHGWSWDFARVRQLGVTTIWSSQKPGGEIDEARFTEGNSHRTKDFDGLWRDIKKHSSPI